MLLVLNGHHDLVEFTLPPFEGGMEWMLELDTNIPGSPPEYRGKAQDKYGMTGRSMILLVGVTVREAN
jgi:isoamylase